MQQWYHAAYVGLLPRHPVVLLMAPCATIVFYYRSVLRMFLQLKKAMELRGRPGGFTGFPVGQSEPNHVLNVQKSCALKAPLLFQLNFNNKLL